MSCEQYNRLTTHPSQLTAHFHERFPHPQSLGEGPRVLKIYQRTSAFPADEKFGLTNQLRRAATAIPMNIADACGTAADADFTRHFYAAIRSCSEVEYQLILARDLRYISAEEEAAFNTAVVEVRRMLIAFVQKMNS